MAATVDTQAMAALVARHPVVRELAALTETAWFNPALRPAAQALPDVGLSADDVADAADRLRRFAPYLAHAFPSTRASAGIIESPLVAVPALQAALGARWGRDLPGQLWLKLDSALPVSGSIKARGGIYEVLRHAEQLAAAQDHLAAYARGEALVLKLLFQRL